MARRLTYTQNIQALWEQLLANGTPTKEEFFQLLDHRENGVLLKDEILTKLLELDLDLPDLVRMAKPPLENDDLAERVSRRIMDDPEVTNDDLLHVANLGGQCGEEAAKRILDSNTASARILHDLAMTYWFYARPRSSLSATTRLLAWQKRLAHSTPEKGELYRCVECGTLGLALEAGRLLVSIEPENLNTLCWVLGRVPALQDEIWPKLVGLGDFGQLESAWYSLRIHHQVFEEGVAETPDETRRERMQQEVDYTTSAINKIASEMLKRFRKRTQLLHLVTHVSTSQLEAGRLLLACADVTRVDLRKIIRHVPELQAQAWAAIQAQGLSAADVRYLRRYAPQLRDQLPEDAPKSTPKPRVPKCEKRTQRDDILRQLLGKQ